MVSVGTPAVVVAGHICLDITPALNRLSAGTLESLLHPGKLVRVGAADVHTGGCVANTGMALQLLGVSTRLIARVGADAFGALVRELACASGAECALSVDEESSTSYSVVLAPPGVDRVFLHHAGANERFSQTDVAKLAGARLLHFGYPSLMPGICRNDGAELRTLFQRAKALGLMTSLDMAAIDPDSQAAQVDWPALLRTVLPQADCFLPSAEELCFMLDRPRHAEWLAHANGRDVTSVLDIRADVAPLAEKLLSMGAKIVLVKCGARGIYYRTADETALSSLPLPAAAWANREAFQPAYKPREVVSATGAGDTSIAAFLASLLEGLPPETCVRRAAAEGACCVEACDALSGLLPFAQLDGRISAGWQTNGTSF